jgi:sporulation integral membrane protein YlbJ
MKKIKTKISYLILILPLLFFSFAIIAFPDRYIPATLRGILLWAECVLPSLFPFMVITLILIKSGCANKAAKPLYKVTKKFNLPPPAAIIFLMSVFSGYPAGSRIVYEYYNSGNLSQNDCKKLSVLCSSSGPLFMLGSVGYKMFFSLICGVKLLCAHLITIIFTSIIFCITRPREENYKLNYTQKPKSNNNVLYDSFYDAVIAVLVSGGFICFFYTFAEVCCDFNLTLPLKAILTPIFGEEFSFGFCYGLIEATGGCAYIAKSGHPLSLPAAGFLITFGGVSILLQQLCYLIKCGVKPLFFVSFKLLQATVCFVILWLLCLF